MTLIGISGKKGHGKDALCNSIKSLCEPMVKVQRIGFADSLKEEVAKACGVTVDYVEENKTIFRTMLQWWGTEFRRSLTNNNYWVEKVLHKINKSNADVIVVPDVRFLNEANAIREVGGLLVRVIRDLEGDIKDMHPSETELDDYGFDSVILNTGTFTDLRKAARQLLTRIKGT